jgi:xylan 1,4-beta-xylosidase
MAQMRFLRSQLAVLIAGACACSFAVVGTELRVDFAASQGRIRPLHGVNLGPLCYRGTVDLSEYHRALGIPLTRLHDVPWVNSEAVDIHTLFPDFRNDPALPASYRFGTTDDYILAVTNVQSKIVYRLGESIEHTARKYYVHPPSDPEQWASVCLGIIRHYNEGWANGFRHGIQYWEIWNEPDVRPAMWTGTDEQYFRLYAVTAKAIKTRFPEVKVGGPALGGTGQFANGTFHPSPFLTNFLSFCQQHEAPLDFFSWHSYTSDPRELPRRAHAVRQVLDQYGFARSESHLNEWNYLPNNDWRPMLREGQGLPRARWYEKMGGPEGAAFVAAALLLLQDAPVDAANFYTAEIQGFGLFSFEGVPKRTFYAFRAFRELLDTPWRVKAVSEQPERVAVVAGLGADKRCAGILVSNDNSTEEQFALSLRNRPWSGETDYELLLVDASHELTPAACGRLGPSEDLVHVTLKAPAVGLIKLRASER